MLLDRRQAAREIESRFRPQLDALAELVDFASGLVERAFEASHKTNTDVIVLGVLLKEVVAMVDAVEVLLRAGAVHAAFRPARAALEALLYLEWILHSDSAYKADCYVLANLQHERLWAARTLQASSEALAFGKHAGDLGLEIDATLPEAEAYEDLDPDKTYPSLSVETLKNARLSAERGRRWKGDAQWYNLAGAGSLRRIAQQVGRLPQYHFYFARGAHVSHSTLYKDHVRFENEAFSVLEVRGAAGADELLRSALEIVLAACSSVLRRYRVGELREFGARYAERWRAPLAALRKAAPTV